MLSCVSRKQMNTLSYGARTVCLSTGLGPVVPVGGDLLCRLSWVDRPNRALHLPEDTRLPSRPVVSSVGYPLRDI